ncbi:MAG: helix-turn-helix domain-containing protein [Bacteroidota bacterium]|nr:helix-turn-helix domain-containing protein [Bacteroidota bacterium]
MIKNRLLQIRLQMGYRFQNEFAEFLGINIKDYNRIENNKKQVSLEVALRISKKICKPVEDIFELLEE